MTQSQPLPRSLSSDGLFEHKRDILALLQSGAAVIRREERLVPADSHHAIYNIRLGLARDSRITRGHEKEAASSVKEIELFLSNLGRDHAALTRAWHVRVDDGRRFTIIENEATGEMLGVLSGHLER